MTSILSRLPHCVIAALLLLALPAAQAQPTGNIDVLAARLQELEDREAIRTLLEHYIELNESRNWRAYSQLFADNGELVMSTQTLVGPEAIFSLLDANFGGDKVGPGHFLYHASHLLTNVRIAVNGDSASALSNWSLLVPDDAGHAVVYQAGKYQDSLVRVNGVWKFQQRRIITDIPVPQ